MELTFEKFDFSKNLSMQRELFIDCFPETAGSAIQSDKHYLWKFHSFPGDIPSWEYSALIESEMVGYYAAIPYRYNIGDRMTKVGMVCDVMTSTKYRGKGIFTKMGGYSTRDLSNFVPFTIGYPIRKEVIPGHLKIGWKIAFPLPLFIKFFKTDSLLKTKKLGFLSVFINPFLSVYNYLRHSKVSKEYLSCIYDSIDEISGYQNFALSWGKTIRNSLYKDIDFARWRYGAPDRYYKFLTISADNELIAFVSYRKILREGVPSFGILDYMVLPGYEDSHGLIMKILGDEASKDNVECLLCMMSNHSAKTYKLYNNGFLKSPFVFQLIIKKFSDQFSDDELYSEKNWHLMWVDSDDL